MLRKRQDLFRKSEAAKYFPKGMPMAVVNNLIIFRKVQRTEKSFM